MNDALTAAQQFKFGFLYKCAEAGLTPDEACVLAAAAADAMEKAANGLAYGPMMMAGMGSAASGLGSLVGGVGSVLLPFAALAAAPMALGGTMLADAAHQRRKAQLESFKRDNKVDVQDFQNLELINEYQNQLRQIRKSMDERRRTAQPRATSSY